MYELIVAMDTDGNIGVTDAMGRQRMPWESEATHKSGEVATSKSGEVATHKSGEVATSKSGEVATSKSEEVATYKIGEVVTSTSKSEEVATYKIGEVVTSTSKSKAIKEDMRYFREKTMNNILIMGRKTFESLPKRPLPGRIHVVLTNNPTKYETEYKNSNSVFFTQLEHLDNRIASLLELYPEKRVFVCGGEEIYRILLPKCERLHITYVTDTYSSVLCENETYTKFPEEEEWRSHYKEVDLVASEFDDDSSLVRRTYVKI